MTRCNPIPARAKQPEAPDFTMLLQLRQPLPFDTPKGPAWAHFLLDYGTEHHLLWICFVNETGECWTFSNPEIRLQRNVSLGVRIGKEE
jgi:hypothetical protein